MRVRKTSWHYKLWMLGRSWDSKPRDLCRYFWHITLFKVLAPLLVIGLALTGIGALIWLMWGHPLESGLAVLAILLLAGVVLVGGWAVDKLIQRSRAKRLERSDLPPKPRKPPKEPSLLWSYLKARKRKMCPLIEVVDPNAHKEEETA